MNGGAEQLVEGRAAAASPGAASGPAGRAAPCRRPAPPGRRPQRVGLGGARAPVDHAGRGLGSQRSRSGFTAEPIGLAGAHSGQRDHPGVIRHALAPVVPGAARALGLAADAAAAAARAASRSPSTTGRTPRARRRCSSSSRARARGRRSSWSASRCAAARSSPPRSPRAGHWSRCTATATGSSSACSAPRGARGPRRGREAIAAGHRFGCPRWHRPPLRHLQRRRAARRARSPACARCCGRAGARTGASSPRRSGSRPRGARGRRAGRRDPAARRRLLQRPGLPPAHRRRRSS